MSKKILTTGTLASDSSEKRKGFISIDRACFFMNVIKGTSVY